MKNDIIIAGVGGQGILSIAAIIATAALLITTSTSNNRKFMEWASAGGEVQSHLRISSSPIASGLDPYWSCRHDHFTRTDGSPPLYSLVKTRWLDHHQYWAFPEYSQLSSHRGCSGWNQEKAPITSWWMPTRQSVGELGQEKAANMVILGAATRFDILYEEIEKAIRTSFGRKGEEIVKMNLSALQKAEKWHYYK